MLDWSTIDSVFLDMDGTLLDLNFDNYFWTEHVPQRYAELHRIDIDAAKAELFPRMKAVEGSMDWYCLDYWSRELGMDVALLKEEVDHLIAVHPHVTDFLDAVRTLGKRMVLVTNAHMKSLELKMSRTQLGGHFDRLICTHTFRIPKERPELWSHLHAIEPFDPERTLLVDDSVPVLESARRYGIAQLVAITRPDSRGPLRQVEGFATIESFEEIMPQR